MVLTGVSLSSTGAPARPTLTLGNLDINKQIRWLIYRYNDLVGCSVTYIRTFPEYLDQPSEISAPALRYTIGQKTSHTNKQITFELRSVMDRQNSYIPQKQMLRSEFPGLS